MSRRSDPIQVRLRRNAARLEGMGLLESADLAEDAASEIDRLRRIECQWHKVAVFVQRMLGATSGAVSSVDEAVSAGTSALVSGWQAVEGQQDLGEHWSEQDAETLDQFSDIVIPEQTEGDASVGGSREQ